MRNSVLSEAIPPQHTASEMTTRADEGRIPEPFGATERPPLLAPKAVADPYTQARFVLHFSADRHADVTRNLHMCCHF